MNEPLTESYFYILLCLQTPNHGYGIMQNTLNLSSGSVKIGAGTMYGAITNMQKKGWIKETKNDASGERGKRLYMLTTMGHEILVSEVKRLHKLLESAKTMGLNENE